MLSSRRERKVYINVAGTCVKVSYSKSWIFVKSECINILTINFHPGNVGKMERKEENFVLEAK